MDWNEAKTVLRFFLTQSSPLTRSILFSVGLVMYSNPVQAAASQALPLLTEDDQLVDIPLVSSATRLAQKRSEAPASITVINREMIDASGAQEIPELLRLVPGFQVYQVNGHKFGVTAHGLGQSLPGRLEVMIDGRSVYLSALSSVDWHSLGIGLDDIDTIEVVRGSNVPTYGSNAFLGAINIITRNAFKDQGTRIKAAAGNRDSARVEFSHNGSIGNHGVRLSAGYLQNDGFDIGDEGQGRYFNLRSTSTPTLADTLELQLGVTQGHAGIGASFLPILDRSYDTNYQSLTWNRDLQDNGSLKVQLYRNYFKAAMEKILLSDALGVPAPALASRGFPDEPINLLLEEGNTERFDLELQHQFRLQSKFRAIWGIGLRQDRGQSVALFNKSGSITENQWRVFGNLEWQANRQLLWNLGAMAEHHDLLGTKTSPRLGLNFQLDPQQSLRASYTLAFRMPSLLDTYQNARLTHSNGKDFAQGLSADTNLQPEENQTVELGYLGTFPALKLDIDLKLFHEKVPQGIERVFSSDPLPLNAYTRTASNQIAWRSRGLEAQFKFRPSGKLWLALQYSYLDLKGEAAGGELIPDPEADPQDNTRIPNDLDLSTMGPKHTLGLLASHRLPQNWDLSINYYQQSTTRYFSGSKIDSYQRLDTRLGKRILQGTTETQIAFVVQNLLDQEYSEFQIRNQFDRRVYLSLSLHFR